jgi:hypothetical protein
MVTLPPLGTDIGELSTSYQTNVLPRLVLLEPYAWENTILSITPTSVMVIVPPELLLNVCDMVKYAELPLTVMFDGIEGLP